MARGVTEQDVFAAADRLLARGQRPTIERVRLEIGRGSPNTINPLLDSWWSNLSKRHAGPATDSLPAPIRLATEALYQEVLRQAERMAQHSVSTLRHEVETDRIAVDRASEQVKAEKLAAQAVGEALKSELAKLRATNERLTQEVSELTAKLESERRDVAEARLKARLADEERSRVFEAADAELGHVRAQWQSNERHWLKEIEALRGQLRQSQQDGESARLTYRREVESLERDQSMLIVELQTTKALLLATNERLNEERQRRLAEEAVKDDARRRPTGLVTDRRRIPLRRTR